MVERIVEHAGLGPAMNAVRKAIIVVLVLDTLSPLVLAEGRAGIPATQPATQPTTQPAAAREGCKKPVEVSEIAFILGRTGYLGVKDDRRDGFLSLMPDGNMVVEAPDHPQKKFVLPETQRRALAEILAKFVDDPAPFFVGNANICDGEGVFLEVWVQGETCVCWVFNITLPPEIRRLIQKLKTAVKDAPPDIREAMEKALEDINDDYTAPGDDRLVIPNDKLPALKKTLQALTPEKVPNTWIKDQGVAYLDGAQRWSSKMLIISSVQKQGKRKVMIMQE